MSDLLGDRFARIGPSWIDLATGVGVRVRLLAAGPACEQLAWDERCATLSRLRHPLLNPLLDYGLADPRRRFEAYGASGAAAAPGAATASLLRHAVSFLEWHGLRVTRDDARSVLRSLVRGAAGRRRRAIGIVLQRRRVLASLADALADTVSGGFVRLTIAGPSGSGLRTLRLLAARAARLGGFVPVCAPVIARYPALRQCLRHRYVCLMIDSPPTRLESRMAATFMADLGVASARGHILLTFARTPESTGGRCLEVDPMGVTSLTSMVFTDARSEPSPDEVWRAAREADGLPGRFLERLKAADYASAQPRPFVVHETAPPYVVEEERRPQSPATRQAGRRLADAPARAARLAARGRHASALRLLTRGFRVLESRGDAALAGHCAEQEAWILRSRGRAAEAADRFDRARALAADEAGRLRATLGVGVAWTDDGRLGPAEATLRSVSAAAGMLDLPELETASQLALARALYWQQRGEEALLVLTRGAIGSRADGLALRARVHLRLGELRPAMISASESVRAAACVRERAIAARALASAQYAAGDTAAARRSTREALLAARAAHLPLQAFRARCERLEADMGESGRERERLLAWAGAALRRELPALYRAHLESAVAAAGRDAPAILLSEPGVAHLRAFIELAHGASDDCAALEAVAGDLLSRLRAATVQIIEAANGEALARVGRPWPAGSKLLDRLIAGCTVDGRSGADTGLEAAAVVRYAEDAIGAVACRWTAGVAVDISRARATLQAAALAIAPAVRALLDRRHARPAGGIREELIGGSPPIVALREAIARAARAPFPVLVEGESGSGKELVARAVHRLGPRRERRLCAINCAALSDELIEAELFGHARGAYTGAVGERPGLFEEADGGTLFLDEIGELSARAQAKLLRVLQDGEVRRVGENLPRRVDTRIVAATNRRLEHEVASGRFRADLRYRLDVIRIRVPPLRERVIDIPALATHFWDEATRRIGSAAVLAPDALAALSGYEWPGNVRELQNAIASIAVQAPRRGRVTARVLPAHLARASVNPDLSFDAARREFERRYVAAALARAGGRRSGAARALGISRQGLTKMMRRLKMDDADSAGP
ncbi:MAG TPA: sigma 54-interacting transcriptional regulator [Vicinamibacterales bacterium]|nr:sigma 54-interacting transcriptional regulator [Vicinamibacterales bacterium]